MKKNYILQLSKELKEIYPELDSISEYKLTEALSSLKDIQEKSLPDAHFKSQLFEKLKTLGEMQNQSSRSYQKNSIFSRFSLFGGVFASVFFVFGFMYLMQDTLFESKAPASTVPEIQSPEQTSLSLENMDSEIVPLDSEKSSDTSLKSTLLREADVITPSTQTQISPNTSSSQVQKEKRESLPKQDSAIYEVQQSPITDSPVVESRDSFLEETEVPPSLGDIPPVFMKMGSGNNTSSEDVGAEILSDTDEQTPENDDTLKVFEPIEAVAIPMMLMDSLSGGDVPVHTFSDFCKDSKGKITGTEGEYICKKGKRICSESEYYNGTCYLEEYDENDTEIFLEELIEEIQK